MDVFRMNGVLEVLHRFGCMPRGNRPVGLADIAYWSGVSRSSVYRYCKAMAGLGLVEHQTTIADGRKVSGWRITDNGVSHADYMAGR